MKPLWLPNALTVFRCLAALGVAVLLLSGGDDGPFRHPWPAFALFLVGALTDWLDGVLARRWQAHSDFGRLLDPLADKMIVLLPLFALCLALGPGFELLLIPVVVIALRDVLVTSLRFGTRNPTAVHVSRLAKWKTAIELVAVGWPLAIIAIVADFGDALGTAVPQITLVAIGFWIWTGLLSLATVLSIYTGYRYFRAAFSDA